MFVFKKKYYFIIESIKDLKLKNIKKSNKFNIIYRYKKKENLKDIKKFRHNCKIKKIQFYVANDLSLTRSIKADGLYLSAHNTRFNVKFLANKKINIIGGAHNYKEINCKKMQGCSQILLSRIFKTSYKNKDSFLGIVKFNLLTKIINVGTTALGGINFDNLNKVKNIQCNSIAMSSAIRGNKKIFRRFY